MMELTARRVWFAVFVLVVFVSGLAAGIALDRYYAFGRPPGFYGGPGAPGRPARRPLPRTSEIVDRMSRELELSADQRVKLQEIFERGAERMDSFQTRTRRDFDELRRQVDEEISSILTPEQRKKFSEEQRRRRGREPRPPEGRPRLPLPPG